jgi:hypothetical protein
VQVGSATRAVSRFGSFVASATWLDRWQQPQGPHPNFAIANLRDFLVMSQTVNVIRLPSFAQSTNNFDLTAMDIAGELLRVFLIILGKFKKKNLKILKNSLEKFKLYFIN